MYTLIAVGVLQDAPSSVAKENMQRRRKSILTLNVEVGAVIRPVRVGIGSDDAGITCGGEECLPRPKGDARVSRIDAKAGA